MRTSFESLRGCQENSAQALSYCIMHASNNCFKINGMFKYSCKMTLSNDHTFVRRTNLYLKLQSSRNAQHVMRHETLTLIANQRPTTQFQNCIISLKMKFSISFHLVQQKILSSCNNFSHANGKCDILSKCRLEQ